jgi:hypothetical protein
MRWSKFAESQISAAREQIEGDQQVKDVRRQLGKSTPYGGGPCR